MYRRGIRGATYGVSWCYPFDLGTDVIRTIVMRRGLTDATSYCKRRSDSDPSQRSVDGSRLPESGRGWPVHRNYDCRNRSCDPAAGIAMMIHSRPMKLGICLHYGRPIVPRMLEVAQRAEERGLDFGHDDQGQGLHRWHL